MFSNLKLVGLKSSPVKCVLRCILVATESRMRLDEEHSTQRLVTADQLIPSRKRHVHVGVSSCFEKGTTLEARDLSDKEIMATYDIEESVQAALTGYARHTGMTLTGDFVMEAPVKVLYRLTQLVMQAWKDSQDFSGNDRCKQGRDLTEEDTDDGRRQSKQEQDPEKAMSIKRPKVVTTQASDVPFQVSTKNDDAPVEVTNWDIWTVIATSILNS